MSPVTGNIESASGVNPRAVQCLQCPVHAALHGEIAELRAVLADIAAGAMIFMEGGGDKLLVRYATEVRRVARAAIAASEGK